MRTSRPVLLLTQNSCPLHFFVKSIAIFSRDLISDPYNNGLYAELNICNGGESINNVGRRQNDEDDVTQNEKQSQYLHS